MKRSLGFYVCPEAGEVTAPFQSGLPVRYKGKNPEIATCWIRKLLLPFLHSYAVRDA
jgi:hypothetical protein